MNDEYIDILTGEFLKNAGIVGFVYMLQESEAVEGEDYLIVDNKLQVKKEYLKNMHLTDLYFKCMVDRYRDETIVKKIMDELEYILGQFSIDDIIGNEKVIQEKLAFISDKLSAASFKTGIESIKDKIEDLQIYYDVTAKSFKKSKIDNLLYQQLLRLKSFLDNDIVFETLCFKNIIYNFINKFWERSFLLRNNAKKNMKECFQNDFVEPLLKYLDEDTTKMKDQCIECGNPINNKYAVSISFMNDFADDLSRKKSSVYNYNVDMNLCPICTFIYSLTPLGFLKYNRDFIFVNQNESIEDLCRVNDFNIDHTREEIKKDFEIGDKYQKIYQIIENYALDKQKLTNHNIQIITRSVLDNDKVKYQFDILDSYLVSMIGNKTISNNLEYFKKKNVVKINDTYISVFREIIKRFLNKSNMYDLIQLLLKQSIDNSQMNYLAYYASRVVDIQYILKGGNSMGELYHARKDGNKLRGYLGKNVDEAYRGTIYQLTNALRVDNRVKFVDIVLRLYTSMSKPVPFCISRILESENGLEIGYQFLTGLKGAYDEIENKEELNHE